MNANVAGLSLYRHEGLWCFDYPELGIVLEPFVEGMTELIDAVLAEKPETLEHPVLVFSEVFTPATRLRLEWMESRESADGPWNRYHCPDLDLSGWLCPCLLKFFPAGAPAVLHFDIYSGNSVLAGDRKRFTSAAV